MLRSAETLARSLRIHAGALADAIRASETAAARALDGLWARDPSIWSRDPAVQGKIAQRLGWLATAGPVSASLSRVRDFAADIRRDGFSDIVLLGMGGSSLAPEVLRAVLGVAPGWPRFRMLDSTDPAAVRAASSPPETTLYILASKSGATIEPNSLAAHFRTRLVDAGISPWARHFVAITDEGTDLAKRARAEGFRDVFINPSDIGGRYSALSLFGLVPAALMGHDIGALADWGAAMLDATRDTADTASNPALALGLVLGAGAANGRDKMTLMLPPELEAFGLWVEQLVAESTGKHGVGVVPIVGEPSGPLSNYSDDRMFVRVVRSGHHERALEPGASIEVPKEPAALGAEFMRWEIATAIAGALLDINPFDEPNVQQAKDATRVLLEAYQREGRLPRKAVDQKTKPGVELTLSRAARDGLPGRGIENFLDLVRQGDYVALLAYVAPDAGIAEPLQKWRIALRDVTGAATTFGYGPRYLHSTGQLHKGGPNTGVFVIVTATPATDVPIPGERYTFGTLELAQALGDFASLDDVGRRALHVHLPAPSIDLLEGVSAMLTRRSRVE